MFDKYMIVEDSLANTADGFSFRARLPYYRGLGLSMVEEIAVTIDGTPRPRDAVRLTLRGKTYSLDAMETVFDDRWNFGEEGVVTVVGAQLSDGGHILDLSQRCASRTCPSRSPARTASGSASAKIPAWRPRPSARAPAPC